jgi:hypothetical protein
MDSDEDNQGEAIYSDNDDEEKKDSFISARNSTNYDDLANLKFADKEN